MYFYPWSRKQTILELEVSKDHLSLGESYSTPQPLGQKVLLCVRLRCKLSPLSYNQGCGGWLVVKGRAGKESWKSMEGRECNVSVLCHKGTYFLGHWLLGRMEVGCRSGSAFSHSLLKPQYLTHNKYVMGNKCCMGWWINEWSLLIRHHGYLCLCVCFTHLSQ